MKGIRVTVEDLETGEKESRCIQDNYIIVTTGRCYITHTTAHKNGTHVLTIKEAIGGDPCKDSG